MKQERDEHAGTSFKSLPKTGPPLPLTAAKIDRYIYLAQIDIFPKQADTILLT